MMGVPLDTTFDSATETLTITYADQTEGSTDTQQAAGSAAGRRRAFQQQQRSSGSGNGQEQQQQPASAQLGLNNEAFNLRVWLDHMQGKVINRQHISKSDLPLQVGRPPLESCVITSC
jgi:hypothetical protein